MLSGYSLHINLKSGGENGGEGMNKKLKRNRIRCKQCNDIIESKSNYDFQTCKCGAIAVDGGLEYAKRIFPGNLADQYYEDLSEFE